MTEKRQSSLDNIRRNEKKKAIHGLGAAVRCPFLGAKQQKVSIVGDYGCLPFTRDTKFCLENQMIRAIPRGKALENTGFVSMRYNFSTLVCLLADLDILCSESFSLHVKFYSFMFMHKSSIRVDCKHPYAYMLSTVSIPRMVTKTSHHL